MDVAVAQSLCDATRQGPHLTLKWVGKPDQTRPTFVSSLNFNNRLLCNKHAQVFLIQMSFGFLPFEGMLNPNNVEESVKMVVDMQDQIVIQVTQGDGRQSGRRWQTLDRVIKFKMVDGILLFALRSPITWSPTSKLGARFLFLDKCGQLCGCFCHHQSGTRFPSKVKLQPSFTR